MEPINTGDDQMDGWTTKVIFIHRIPYKHANITTTTTTTISKVSAQLDSRRGKYKPEVFCTWWVVL